MASTMYSPESPAHSVHEYSPESPAHSEINTYFPESPRRPFKKQSLIERLLNPTDHKKKKSPLYTPIHGWRFYVKHYMINEKKNFNCIRIELQNAIKNDEFTKIETLTPIYNNALKIFSKAKEHVANISFNERKLEYKKSEKITVLKSWKHDICNINDKKQKESINVSSDPYRVIMKTVIQEDGHISVSLSAPLAVLHDTYHKNLLKPPRAEYLKALSEFGYPKWYIDKHRNDEENQAPSKTVHESLLEGKNKKVKKQPSKLSKFKSK